MEHKTFRVTEKEGIRWFTFYKFTKSNRKESGYFASLFILLPIVLNQIGFSEGAVGSLITGVLSIFGVVHLIRWFYLVIKEKVFKK